MDDIAIAIQSDNGGDDASARTRGAELVGLLAGALILLLFEHEIELPSPLLAPGGIVAE